MEVSPYKAVRSEDEALSLLSASFNLSPPELHDLAHALLGLPRPFVVPEKEVPDFPEGTEELPEQFPRVVGMVGYMRTGKDLVASFLDQQYRGVYRLAYSDPIISECNEFLSSWGHRITEKNKDDYRLFLQNWSMARRSEEEEYWSRTLREQIDRALQDFRVVVISGARLPADVRLVQEYGGELWRVVRPHSQKSLHPNEAWISEIRCSKTIHNEIEGDTASVRKQIEDIVESYR